MATLPDVKCLQLELKAGWLTIRFNQPESRNALSEAMATELFDTLEAIQSDRSVRAVIFRGNGGAFCAGGDLKAFQKIAMAGGEAKRMARELSHRVATLFHAIKALPQLTVSIVEGAAMAGGFGIACASDLVIAKPEARFALTETRIGLTPAQLAPYAIDRLGFRNARRLMLLALDIKGPEALEIGLADALVQNESELEDYLDTLHQQLCRCAPEALAMTKEILCATQEVEAEALVTLAANRFAESVVGAEGKEGFMSFMQKRQPGWCVTASSPDNEASAAN